MVVTVVNRAGVRCVCAIFFYMSCVFAQSGEMESNLERQNGEYRDPKWFSFVRITNRVCGPEDNRGSCYSSKDCMSRGGSPIAGVSCANGFGVCCSVSVSCAAGVRRVSTSENVAVLSSTSSVPSCIFTVNKSGADICQLRVDLTRFDLGAGPDLRGNCQQAYLSISDSVTVGNNFRLCGRHAGRKLFLTFEEGASVIDFNFRSTDVQSTYELRVTQIKCIDKIVPDHCLEYYDETQPTRVTSFGYPAYMINNPIYNICVHSPASSTGVQWDTCPENPALNQTFILSPWFTNMGGDKQIAISGHDNCEGTSFVEIVGAGRHCGAKLKIFPNGPALTSMVKTFSLAVRFVADSHADLQPYYVFPYPATPIPYPATCMEIGTANGAMVRAFGVCTAVMGGDPAAQVGCQCPRSMMPIMPVPVVEPLITPARTGFCLVYNYLN